MSSLQKFHRRTQTFGPPLFSFTAIGNGDGTHGYWLGTAGDNTSKLIVAPKSTEMQQAWGSPNISRGVISTTNGLGNTNILYSYGQIAHPAAYYCKTLTTGGYNTWYLPAMDELITCWTNHTATPFVTANSFSTNTFHWSSTEVTGQYCAGAYFLNGALRYERLKDSVFYVRAIRRVI